MPTLLDERRLAEQAGARHPELFRDIALRWAEGVPTALGRVRRAAPEDLPAALHELRSGAVAVGLAALPGVLAAVEQAAERGLAVAAGELEAALALAERSAEALTGFWAAAARGPGCHPGDGGGARDLSTVAET